MVVKNPDTIPLNKEELDKLQKIMGEYIPSSLEVGGLVRRAMNTLENEADQHYGYSSIGEPAEVTSYQSGGGPTAKIEMNDANYLIIYNKGHKDGEGIDISFRNRIIRIYQDEQWSIHAMDRNSQTRSMIVLANS